MKTFSRYLASGLLAIIAATGAAVATAQQGSPDKASLDQLAGTGSDLSKLHRFEFLLKLPTQKAAERAASKMDVLAFETNVERGKSDTEWLVHGGKRLYPIESDLNGLRDKLNAIAAQEHGSYEGWKAKAIN
jgi:hypothetical protein